MVCVQLFFILHSSFFIFFRNFAHKFRVIDTIDMGKTKKVTGNHHKLQVVTLCISTTMVLVLLGLAVFFAFTARNLSSYVKENLTVTVMLSDSTTNRQIVRMHNAWKKKPYTHRITYVSKEQAKNCLLYTSPSPRDS